MKVALAVILMFGGTVAGFAAEWIRPNAESSAEANVAVFRRTVDVKKDLKRAEWRVTALGAFEAKVNGTAVSRFLDPGFTQPEKTRYEVAYDVTAQLKCGANALEAAVAPTWWRCRMTRRAYPKVGPPNPPNAALRATLRLEYADGSREEIATDGSWLSAYTGPVTDAGIYDGERYDARKGVTGLAASVPCDDFKGEVQPRRGPPILLREDLVLKPASAYVWQGVKDTKGTNEFGKVIVRRRFDTWEAVDLKPGETLVVDFGQNSSAVPRFEVEGAAGTELSVKMCEMLNDSNGERARRCDGPAGSAMLANLRSAKADIRYVLREAAGHFTVQCHPQTIAYVPTREPTRWSDLRQQAFADELAARGRKLAVYGGAGASRDDLNAWIRELPKPAGILAAYDDRAYDVLEACRAAGVRVPQEVSVLGIGNDEQTCEMSVPPLTSLAVDFEMQGYRAARELQAMMLRRRRKPLQRQILCGVRETVIRNSTLVGKSDSLADRARTYIDRHALEGISPDDVVRHLNASRSLVYLRFRQAFGESPLDAILAKRLGEVKRLLETTALPMSEIAVRCGYRDANYLKNLFKKRFGCTMLAWRKGRRRQS